MNVIASVIIYHALNFSEEKRIMELIMRQLNYRKIYLDRLQGSQAEAVKTIAHLRENVHDLYKFLVRYVLCRLTARLTWKCLSRVGISLCSAASYRSSQCILSLTSSLGKSSQACHRFWSRCSFSSRKS